MQLGTNAKSQERRGKKMCCMEESDCKKIHNFQHWKQTRCFMQHPTTKIEHISLRTVRGPYLRFLSIAERRLTVMLISNEILSIRARQKLYRLAHSVCEYRISYSRNKVNQKMCVRSMLIRVCCFAGKKMCET